MWLLTQKEIERAIRKSWPLSKVQERRAIAKAQAKKIFDLIEKENKGCQHYCPNCDSGIKGIHNYDWQQFKEELQ